LPFAWRPVRGRLNSLHLLQPELSHLAHICASAQSTSMSSPPPVNAAQAASSASASASSLSTAGAEETAGIGRSSGSGKSISSSSSRGGKINNQRGKHQLLQSLCVGVRDLGQVVDSSLEDAIRLDPGVNVGVGMHHQAAGIDTWVMNIPLALDPALEVTLLPGYRLLDSVTAFSKQAFEIRHFRVGLRGQSDIVFRNFYPYCLACFERTTCAFCSTLSRYVDIKFNSA
jgi:hypothetical protein